MDRKLVSLIAIVLMFVMADAAWAGKSLDDQMLSELKKANPGIDGVQFYDSKRIDGRYSVVAVYASSFSTTMRPHYRRGSVPIQSSPLSGQRIGVFVVDSTSNKIVMTLGIVQSERSNDFFPHITEATRNKTTIEFTSDYRVEAVKEYMFDLKTMTVLAAKRLPTPPAPTMCDHDGKTEPCFD